MKKVLLFVVVAFASIAPTFAQNTVNVPNQQPVEQHFPVNLPYYAPTPQPQVIVRNYCPAPTVRVTNPEVTVPVTIQQLPPVAPMQNPDDFTGHEILFMLIIAVVACIIGFIFGLLNNRNHGSSNSRPQIFHIYGAQASAESLSEAHKG